MWYNMVIRIVPYNNHGECMICKESPIYQQIIMHFESRIFDGTLQAGSRIPPTSELARSFAVNPETVQTALKRLMERGLVERRRGAGTFVRKGIKGRTAAIVFGENNFTRIDRSFFNILLKCLMRRLPAAGWDFRHFITTERPEADAAFHELEKAVADGSVRAVIEFCTNDMIIGWLDNGCLAPSSRRATFIDYPDILAQALEYLMKLGRKDIAVVCGKERESLKAYEEIAAGICGRPGAASINFQFAGDTQRDGYATTMELLNGSGSRPDAIASLCDSASRGIIFALLEKGVRIPEEIAFITHSNKGVELFSHIELTRLEIDPDKLAMAMVDEIICKIEGKQYKQLPVKATLIEGLSCGERKT